LVIIYTYNNISDRQQLDLFILVTTNCQVFVDDLSD